MKDILLYCKPVCCKAVLVFSRMFDLTESSTNVLSYYSNLAVNDCFLFLAHGFLTQVPYIV